MCVCVCACAQTFSRRILLDTRCPTLKMLPPMIYKWLLFLYTYSKFLATESKWYSFFLKHSCCTIFYKLQVYNVVIHNF